MKHIIKIGSLVMVIPKNAIGEVEGFERKVGDEYRTVVVRILRTNEIVKVHDSDLKNVA